MLRVDVLGALAVEAQGQRVEGLRGHPLLLVGYLAVAAGSHQRREVAEQLWPDSEPDRARARLRTAVWQVARALDPRQQPLLRATRTELGLDPAVVVDLSEARRFLACGANEQAVSLLSRGLAEELGHEWAEPTRREVEVLLHRALEAAVHDAPDIALSIARARRRLAFEPLSEAAYQDLIRVLAESGDRGAALAAYETMRVRLQVDLGVTPSAASRRLLTTIASESPQSPHIDVSDAPHAIPAATSPIVGRDLEIVALEERLNSERLVTVVGPGGVGKTRVAFAAADARSRAGNMVVVAELAEVRRWDACEYAIASAFSVSAAPGMSLRAALVHRLNVRPCLLVLDNCEHLLGVVPELVSHLLRWSGRTVVLATSREPLRLPGESVFRLGPLPLPAAHDGDEAIEACPSVQLLTRKLHAGHGNQLLTDSPEDLARIARRLDGLPLALELAAAKLPSLGAAALETQLSKGLEVLSSAPLARNGRHDSLINTLQWSVSMLSPQEQRLLARLSVFSGPFPLGAVECLAHAVGESTDVVVGLVRLVEASLIQAHTDPVRCYSTLETVRLFAQDLLGGAAAAARQGLVDWAVGFCDDVKWRSLRDEERLNREVQVFLPLVRAALQEAKDSDDIAAQRRIVTGIEGWGTWREQPEVWSWVVELAANEPEHLGDPEVLRMGALAAWRMGRPDVMEDFTRRCVANDSMGAQGTSARAALMVLAQAQEKWTETAELARHVGEPGSPERIIATTVATNALVRSGRPEAAVQLADSALSEASRYSSPTLQALCLLAEARARAAAENDRPEADADATLNQARDRAASVGSLEIVAWIDREEGLQALRRGDPNRAVEPLGRACAHWLGTGNSRPLTSALTGLAESLSQTARTDAARELLDAHGRGNLRPSDLDILRAPPTATGISETRARPAE